MQKLNRQEMSPPGDPVSFPATSVNSASTPVLSFTVNPVYPPAPNSSRRFFV